MMVNALTHTSIYQIEPLTGAENYTVWKIKMMDILTGQDLWEYVNGMTKEPKEAEAVLLPVWHKKDQIVLSMIWLWVANKMLVYIASSTSAKEALDTLKSLLETQGALGIVQAQ